MPTSVTTISPVPTLKINAESTPRYNSMTCRCWVPCRCCWVATRSTPAATLMLMRTCERCGLFFLIFCIDNRPAFEKCVPFFLFFVSPSGAKSPLFLFLPKTPRYHGKRLGASFFVSFQLQNRTAPGSVYSHFHGICLFVHYYYQVF